MFSLSPASHLLFRVDPQELPEDTTLTCEPEVSTALDTTAAPILARGAYSGATEGACAEGVRGSAHVQKSATVEAAVLAAANAVGSARSPVMAFLETSNGIQKEGLPGGVTATGKDETGKERAIEDVPSIRSEREEFKRTGKLVVRKLGSCFAAEPCCVLPKTRQSSTGIENPRSRNNLAWSCKCLQFPGESLRDAVIDCTASNRILYDLNSCGLLFDPPLLHVLANKMMPKIRNRSRFLLGDPVAQNLAEKMKPMSDSFFVIRLKSPEFAAQMQVSLRRHILAIFIDSGTLTYGRL